ncbi:MAG: hypothetical protein ACI3VY_01075 [Faecousia sp.]
MNIETIWNNIKRHEGDIFHTIKGKPYTYRVHSDCIIVVNIKGAKIKKDCFERAIMIGTPTPTKIGKIGCWGPSYIYGTITDERILAL